jgi:hypothetical protein
VKGSLGRALRWTVFLRSIARSLRLMAESQKRIADYHDRVWAAEHPAWTDLQAGRLPRKPHLAVLGQLDEAAIDRDLARKRAELGLD